MASKDAPCKNCEERHYGCHTGCDLYASYDKERQIEREKRKEACEFERGFAEQRKGLYHKLRQDNNKGKIFRSPKR